MVEDCSEALKLNPAYHKAAVRRARAYAALNEPEKALDGGFSSLNFYSFAVCVLVPWGISPLFVTDPRTNFNFAVSIWYRFLVIVCSLALFSPYFRYLVGFFTPVKKLNSCLSPF